MSTTGAQLRLSSLEKRLEMQDRDGLDICRRGREDMLDNEQRMAGRRKRGRSLKEVHGCSKGGHAEGGCGRGGC